MLLRGLGAAPGVGERAGARRSARSPTAASSPTGDVLVTHMTAPDWVPLMRRAAAIVTDSGGMTCHAAIVSRELGIPCVVGTADATKMLRDGELVTVDADARRRHSRARGAAAPRGRGRRAPRRPPRRRRSPATKLLVNLSEPSQVERAAALDVDGVGLLRAELMVLEALEGVHPRLLLEEGRGDEFVERMADGADRRSPPPSRRGRSPTARSTSAPTSSAACEGGERFEPEEANPMIGYRGALRYTREPDLFAARAGGDRAASGTRATRTST